MADNPPPLCSICSDPYPAHSSPASALKLCQKCWDLQTIESQRVTLARLISIMRELKRQ